MKKAIAVVAVVSGAMLAGAPVATATLVCPVGISPPSVYCAEVTPPAVTTGSAGELTSTSATLTGTVNTFGAATTYWFEYGTTTAYGAKTAEASLPAAPGQPASATTSSVSAAVAGLSPSTAYHYRLVAKNAGGTTYGSDMTFTTANAAGVQVLKIVVVTPAGARVILIPLHCSQKPRCVGRLLLLPPGHKSSAAHRASAARASERTARAASTLYGSGGYSIPYNHTGKVRVKLTAAARAALAKHGRLTVAVVAAANGKRTIIGTITIKAKRKPKHVTHAKRRPGFTG